MTPACRAGALLARELQQQELTARSLHAFATLEMVLGEWEKSLSHADEAHMLYTALGNHVREVGCLCVIAQSLINMGQPQDGIDAATAALVMSVEIEDNWGQINAAIQMVAGLPDTGTYTEARSVIEQGVSLARALRSHPCSSSPSTNGAIYAERCSNWMRLRQLIMRRSHSVKVLCRLTTWDGLLESSVQIAHRPINGRKHILRCNRRNKEGHLHHAWRTRPLA